MLRPHQQQQPPRAATSNLPAIHRDRTTKTFAHHHEGHHPPPAGAASSAFCRKSQPCHAPGHDHDEPNATRKSMASKLACVTGSHHHREANEYSASPYRYQKQQQHSGGKNQSRTNGVGSGGSNSLFRGMSKRSNGDATSSSSGVVSASAFDLICID